MPTRVAPSTTELSFSIKNLQKLHLGWLLFPAGTLSPCQLPLEGPSSSPARSPSPFYSMVLVAARGSFQNPDLIVTAPTSPARLWLLLPWLSLLKFHLET